MAESMFVRLALCNFNGFGNYIEDSIKGLSALSTHFAIIYKELFTFHESLSRSLSPLKMFLKTTKSNKSLCDAYAVITESFSKFYESIRKAGEVYMNDATTPLDEFIAKYQNFALAVLGEGKGVIGEIEQSRQKVNKTRTMYSKYEKELFKRGGSNKSKELKEARAKYQASLEEHNKLIKERSEGYKGRLRKLEANERKRVNLILKITAKTSSVIEDLAEQLKQLALTTSKQINKVNSESDVKRYAMNAMKESRADTFDELFFTEQGSVYQLIDQINNNKSKKESKETLDPTVINHDNNSLTPETLEEECKEVKNKCKQLLASKNLLKEDMIRITNHFNNSEVRKAFITELTHLPSSHLIKDFSVLETLGQIINHLLTIVALYLDVDPFVTDKMLSASLIIYSTLPEDPNGSIITLRELISRNTIWTRQEQWIKLIQFRLTEALRKSHLKPNEKDSKTSLPRKNVIYTELLTMAGQMSSMGINKTKGLEILLQFAGYYELSNENLKDLLTHYASGQLLEHDYGLTKEETKSIIKERMGNIDIIKKSISYINNKETLINILLLNKKLKNKVYKKLLNMVSEVERKEIWKLAILDSKYFKIYEEITEKLKNPSEAESNLRSKIQLDTKRSFKKYNEATQIVMSYIIL